MQHVLRAVVFALLLSPAVGIMIGYAIVYLQYLVIRDADIFEVGRDLAVPFGGFFGILFGLVVAWPLRSLSLARIVLTLAMGTMLFAVPGALIPDRDGGGLAIAWIFGMIGFWIGAFALFLHRARETENSV